jgi:hypothetical protein
MRALYVTSDARGAGHVVRGLAIRRAVARVGVVGPPSSYPRLAEAGYRGSDDWYARALNYLPDVLVADLDWLGLRGLADRARRSWLLVRDCPAWWTRLMPANDVARWERVVSVEPLSDGLLHVTHSVPPVVISNPGDARAGLAGGRTVVLRTSGRLAVPEGALEWDLRDRSAPFPACEYVGDAERVICQAGYNAYWESRRMGYFDRVEFVAAARRHEDQAARASGSWPDFAENGADVIAGWLADA